ncbi:unnamed protein product [Polarella glacialis]|uniref:Uncharacterized protein n=1 Tax=Polarella glacialis TaxID=89957 RepID=A0A813G2W2_POLGL|nr:unnamed protein product [Polarella glacialis]CAE8715672.1 unnamed protein product [Polarella glacialis]
MASTLAELATALLLADCRDFLLALLPGPLEWRALQRACRWGRSSGDNEGGLREEGLLWEVHGHPELRREVRRLHGRLSGLPRSDLFGEEVKARGLGPEELHYFVDLLGAHPQQKRRSRSASAGFHLDLSWWQQELQADQGVAVGRFLLTRGPKLLELRLPGQGQLLGGKEAGLCSLLEGLGHCQLVSLRLLDLSSSSLAPPQAALVGKLLLRCPALESLSLAWNPKLFSPNSLEDLLDALGGGPGPGGRVLGQKRLAGLQQLNLKHCQVSARASSGLARLLQHCPRLATLDLQWSEQLFTSAGLQGLCQGLLTGSGSSKRKRGQAAIPQAAERQEHGLQQLKCLKMQGCTLPDTSAETAFCRLLRHCERLAALEAPDCPSARRVFSAGRFRQVQSLKLGEAAELALMAPFLFTAALRLGNFREALRQFLPSPLEWRALQCSSRWSDGPGAGPLQEVHRRPRLRAEVARLRQRLRGLPQNDLLGPKVAKWGLSCEDSYASFSDELRFFVELAGARPRQAGVEAATRLQVLDLSYEHLPLGESCGNGYLGIQGQALGIFIRQCPQLQELKLVGNTHLCSEAGLCGLVLGLGSSALPLRSLLFGGSGVAVQAAPALGRLLRRCPQLVALGLAGNRQLCSEAGLRGLEQGLAAGREGGGDEELLCDCTSRTGSASTPLHRLQRLGLRNCHMDANSGRPLGKLLRRCSQLVELALGGNQGLLTEAGLSALLRGLGDDGFPRLSDLKTELPWLQLHGLASNKAYGRLLQRCPHLKPGDM